MYSYAIDDYGTLSVYYDGYVIATIEDCYGMSQRDIEYLVEEVIDDYECPPLPWY